MKTIQDVVSEIVVYLQKTDDNWKIASKDNGARNTLYTIEVRSSGVSAFLTVYAENSYRAPKGTYTISMDGAGDRTTVDRVRRRSWLVGTSGMVLVDQIGRHVKRWFEVQCTNTTFAARKVEERAEAEEALAKARAILNKILVPYKTEEHYAGQEVGTPFGRLYIEMRGDPLQPYLEVRTKIPLDQLEAFLEKIAKPSRVRNTCPVHDIDLYIGCPTCKEANS